MGHAEHTALSSYWLITKCSRGHMSVFTTRLNGGKRALPVFGHSEEASDFLLFAGLEGGWEIRETSIGELLSLLYCFCKDVQRVLLDPLPGIDLSLLWDLVDMRRQRFVEFLLSTTQPLSR